MWGFSWPVFGFTVVACAAWGIAFWWARKQPREHRWHHYWVLFLATFFWWLGESLAIRLGRYEYPDFPWWTRLPLPGGGTPTDHGRLTDFFLSFVGVAERQFGSCTAGTWAIPLPVVALEAAVLFGLYRISVVRFRSDDGNKFTAGLATGGLSALLMLNITAVLDPVASTTVWCDPAMPNPAYEGLNFNLWRWFTNSTHTGYWFGVPLVNYAAWMLAAATFNSVARWDDHSPGGLVKKHKSVWAYLVVFLVVLIGLILILIPLKKAVDTVLVHGQQYLFSPHSVFFPQVWQFGVIASLLALAFVLLRRGRPPQKSSFEWIPAVPLLLVLAYCLILLMVRPHGVIFAIWLVTTSIATAVIFWPAIARHPLVARLIARIKRRETTPASEPKLYA